MSEARPRAKRKWGTQRRLRDVNRTAVLVYLSRYGSTNFSELLKAVPCSRPVLVDHLAYLEEDRFIVGKTPKAGDQRRIFYSLTLRGRAEVDRAWQLLLLMDEMSRRDASCSAGLPYAGPGFVTHKVVDRDCNDTAAWLAEGIADVVWEGAYRGLSRRIFRKLPAEHPYRSELKTRESSAESRAKAFFAELNQAIGAASAAGENRIVLAFEVNLPILARELQRRDRKKVLLRVYGRESRLLLREEEATAIAAELGLESWSPADLPKLRRLFEARKSKQAPIRGS